MIADLKPYAEYKESGLPWLGQVPTHWEIAPIRSLLRSYVPGSWGADPGEADCTVPCVRGTDFWHERLSVKWDRTPLRSFATYDLNRRGLKRGDLIMSTTGGSADHGIGSVTVHDSDRQAVPTNFAARLVPRVGVDSHFLAQAFRTLAAVGVPQALTNQVTIANLDTRAYLASRVAAPPLDEQTAIVRFLDWANGRLERAIRAKRKVIALLNEQKQAIIHRAVTRGLDPSVPLKPSGIPWLGDIPAHWEVRKVKHLLYAPLAYGVLKPDKYSGTDAVPIIRILDLSRGTVNGSRLERISPQLDDEFKRTRVNPGEVIVSLVGTIGRSAIVPAELLHANLSRALCRVQLRFETMGEFFIAYTQSRVFLDQADAIPSGTAQRVLNLGDLSQFWLGLPPKSEQLRIVTGLGHATGECDAAISRLEREIDLLREYRTRLVADIVTGKLDVREAAARLPDEEALLDTPDTSDTDADDDLAPDEEADA